MNTKDEALSVEDLSGAELEARMDMEQTAAEPEPEAAAKPVTMGIGQLAKHLILKTELSNEEILKRVRATFPAASTTMACIAWYKSDLRKKGMLGAKTAAKSVTLSAEQLEELMK